MRRVETFNLSSLASLPLCTSEGGALAKFRSACSSNTTRDLSLAEVEVASQLLNGRL